MRRPLWPSGARFDAGRRARYPLDSMRRHLPGIGLILILSLPLLAGCGNDDAAPLPTPFEMIAHVPANLATDVDPERSITISFSTSVDAASLTEGAIEIFDAEGPVDLQLGYDEPLRVVSALPSAPLAAGEAYEVRVSDAIASADGQRLPAPLEWHFITACETPHPVPDATWRFVKSGGEPSDTLTIIKSCGGIIAHGSISCSIITLTETAIGRIDAGHSFAASDSTFVSSFRVSGQFTEQDPGTWCLAGSVAMWVIELPHPPTTCQTTLTIREHCTPGTDGVLD